MIGSVPADSDRDPGRRPTVRTSRRAVMGGLAVGATALGLAACGIGNGAGSDAPDPGGRVSPPTFRRFESAKPDVPGGERGVPPVFYNYPDPPVVLDGFPLPPRKPISILVQGNTASPAPEQNPNFRLLAEQTGGEVRVTYVPWTSYREKFTVTVAGGDLPDICSIEPLPKLPALLEQNFSDLSEILGGDGVLKYPALANIPTDAWLTSTINGRIYGIAKPLPPAGFVVTSRGDVMAARGFDDPNLRLRDGGDFAALLADLTDRGRNAFSVGSDPVSWLLTIVKQMVGTPNVWRNDNGTFVHEFETEEMKVALSEAAKIVQAGSLHPQSFSDPGQNSAWFTAGVTALYIQDYVGWGDFATRYPEWNVGNIEIPRWEGGGLAPIRMTSPGFSAWMAFKKSDPDRLHELLSFANYIASPFGTQQYLDVFFGKLGESYTMDGTNPVAVKDGPSLVGLQNMGGNHRAVLYSGGRDHTSIDAQRDYAERVLPSGVQNAALGLYSETSTAKAASFVNEQNEVQREILQGTKPMAAWDEFVATWRTEVGNRMAEEYATAAAAR